MEAPLVAIQHVTHRPTALPPHLPPCLPLPDKVAHKPQKRPRPPSPAAPTKSRKHARQPHRPIRPLSLKRTTASQPQLEPPPPKCRSQSGTCSTPPPPSTNPPPRYLRPRPHPFSPHNEVLHASPPLPRGHQLTIILKLIQRVISLKKPRLQAPVIAAIDSPSTA